MTTTDDNQPPTPPVALTGRAELRDALEAAITAKAGPDGLLTPAAATIAALPIAIRYAEQRGGQGDKPGLQAVALDDDPGYDDF